MREKGSACRLSYPGASTGCISRHKCRQLRCVWVRKDGPSPCIKQASKKGLIANIGTSLSRAHAHYRTRALSLSFD